MKEKEKVKVTPKPKSENFQVQGDLKVKNFQRNYLESKKFFSKFSYFLERENFQNLKVT